ncbi:MAG: precorrin-3B C(17)-methyltransferase [Rhodospirillales bacterium]|nr:precorrin-3B C(17)-methyltransferase [Rhodospirillales bacterium]
MSGESAGPLGAPAILILGQGSLATATRIRDAFSAATIHGLAGRVEGADRSFDGFGEHLRDLYRADVPLVVLCAAGIVIRALSALLADKRAEPPVIAVAEDGSAVVPLLGGLRGANALARRIATALGTTAAITTTGEVRFGLTLEDLPEGYALRDKAAGKRFMSDLLAGATLQIDGDAPWIDRSKLALAQDAALRLVVTPEDRDAAANELIVHPRVVVVALADPEADIPTGLRAAGLSPLAVAFVLAPNGAAVATDLPLRFAADVEAALRDAVPDPMRPVVRQGGVAVALARSPDQVHPAGKPRGSLRVVGLGPGDASLLAPAARAALSRAQDILGYGPYLKQGGPYLADQRVHESDNREELDRARHAFRLAAEGRDVAVVSSGDPGVFAMAAAVMEALDGAEEPAWHGVRLQVVPGISAAMGAAALAGAPLGHDFALISLSDNLKPWDIIARRLDAAGAADLVVALYNPISQARPTQFDEAIAILRRHRRPETVVLLGHNVGRAGERLTVTTLGALKPEQVDMRTVVIVGSSQTRTIARAGDTPWVYTPRSYPKG